MKANQTNIKNRKSELEIELQIFLFLIVNIIIVIIIFKMFFEAKMCPEYLSMYFLNFLLTFQFIYLFFFHPGFAYDDLEQQKERKR